MSAAPAPEPASAAMLRRILKDLDRIPMLETNRSADWTAAARAATSNGRAVDWVGLTFDAYRMHGRSDVWRSAEFDRSEINGDIARVFDRVKLVSNAEFGRALVCLTDWVNDNVRDGYFLCTDSDDNPSCRGDTCDFKSNEWVYKNVQHLIGRPSGVADRKAYRHDGDTLLLLDDAMYTGGQSAKTVRESIASSRCADVTVFVGAPYTTEGAVRRIRNEVFGEQARIRIVHDGTSFFTEGAFRRNPEDMEAKSVKVYVARIHIIPTLKEVIREAGGSHLVEGLLRGGSATAFEFKIADRVSFPVVFADEIAKRTGQCAGTQQNENKCLSTEPYKRLPR